MEEGNLFPRRIALKLLTLYVILPAITVAFVMTPWLVAIGTAGNNMRIDPQSLRASAVLDAYPVAFMSPEKSGDVYYEMASVRDIFVEFNEKYGDKYSIYSAVDRGATVNKLMQYIETTDRIHISAHGYYDMNIRDSVVTLYNSKLTKNIVNAWSLEEGSCKLLYLSSCYALGKHPYMDYDLVAALRHRTSIEVVMAYYGPVTIGAATIISQSFWKVHGAYSRSETLSSAVAYEGTKNKIETNLLILPLVAGVTVGTIVGAIAACAKSGIGAIFLEELVSELATLVLCWAFLSALETAIDNWHHVGDVSVPGFVWEAAGGSSSRPIIGTH